MDSTSSTSRFRFRDHLEGVQQSSGSEHSSDISSVSSEPEYDSEPESMTGKGINRLCSELLELKKVSDEKFHRSISSDYSTFLRLFEELEGMGKELLQLKDHISTQNRLTKDLTDGVFLMNVSNHSTELILEEPFYANDSTTSKLEDHVNHVLEVLDSLFIEKRFDEAMSVIEMEELTVKRIQLEENCSSDVLTSYDATIYERKAMLANQFMQLAENPRTPPPELQKALIGLNKLGESHAAGRLLLSYYHSRLETGIHHFESSNSATNGLYMIDLSKFVFSTISQAATSFRSIYGETSNTSELVKWACHEAEIFASCFKKYVKSISDINGGGLLTVVEAVKSTLKFCNLLDTKRVVSQSCLIMHIRPSIEEFLRVHIGNLKKVIVICASNDTWVLSRYLVSGILPRGCSSMVTGQQLNFCHFTNSGRMFMTLLQPIVEDISPLAALEIESSILRGLTDLLMEYIDILEKSMTCEATTAGEDGSINFAESMPQEVSILINISTLVLLFSNIVKDTFISGPLNDETKQHLSDGSKQKELDKYLLLVQEASGRVRAHFYQLFIDNIMLVEDDSRAAETHVDSQADSNNFNDRMPSTAFQVLFLELRKLEKFIEDNAVELDWLMELLAELMETIIVSIRNDKDIWAVIDDDITVQHFENFEQFVIDMHFLVEVARHGGYLSANILNASIALVSDMESAFLSAGLDPKRDVVDDQWATKAAVDAIQRLLQNELHPGKESATTTREEEPAELQSEISCSDDDVNITSETCNEFKEDDFGDADKTSETCNKFKEDDPVTIETENDPDIEKESSSEETSSAQEKVVGIRDRISMLQEDSIRGVRVDVCNTEGQSDEVTGDEMVTFEAVANSI